MHVDAVDEIKRVLCARSEMRSLARRAAGEWISQSGFVKITL